MTKLRWEWTVPNILSLFRIALIPVLVLTYLSCDDIWLPASVLVLSGLTDLLDGWIARHFNQISEIGKLLDPIADKLTPGNHLSVAVVAGGAGSGQGDPARHRRLAVAQQECQGRWRQMVW